MKPKISNRFLVLLVFILFEYVSCSMYSSPDINPLIRECTWLYKENPNDCRSYFQCRHGKPLLRRCPRQLHWNSVGMFCDYKYRAECKAGNRPTSILNALPNSDKLKEKCVAGTYAINPNDCGSFYHCDGSGKYGVLQMCPAGLYFNQKLSICDWPHNVNCSPGNGGTGTGIAVAPQQQPSTAQPTPPPTYPTNSPTASTLPPFFPTETPPAVTTSSPPRPIPTVPPQPSSTTPESTTYPILIPNSDFKVFCYYASWAIWRKNGGKFTPRDIDPSKCTHLIYAFAVIDHVTFEIKMNDEYVDGEQGLNSYKEILEFKKLGLKVMIAIGGWEDSGHPKWNDILSDPSKMQKFFTSAKTFIGKHGFDGIDMDYEYPRCPKANCMDNLKHQRNGFSVLIRGLRETLGNQVIITVAISSYERILQIGYDLKTISVYVDFLNVMAYDYNGAWDDFTGILAPLSITSKKENPVLTVQHTLHVLFGMGVPPEKICLGIPTYASSYKLADPKNYGIGAPVAEPGDAGNMTNQRGILSMKEVCREEFQIEDKDPENRRGPFRVNFQKRLWISLDDQDSVGQKCNSVLQHGLAGVMIWSVDMEDSTGEACGERYPILSAINRSLRSPEATVYSQKWKKIREEAKQKSQKQRVTKTSSRSRRRRF